MTEATVLVTGAGSTIGSSLIPRLLKGGYSILAQVRTTNREIEEIALRSNGRMQILEIDLQSKSLGMEVSNAFATMQKIPYGVIHLASAPLRLTPLQRTTIDEIESHMSVTVHSLHAILSTLWKIIKKSERFRIIAVNTAAIGGVKAPKGMTPYLTAKAAMSQYLRCVEAELSDANVTVNQISPEMFRSPLIKSLPEYLIEQYAGGSYTENSKIKTINPPTDIIPLIMFLLSADAGKISGENMKVQRI